MNLKSYRAFEMDLCDLQELLAEYFTEQSKSSLKDQILFGFPFPTNIKALSVEGAVALSRNLDLRRVLENALLKENKIEVGEAFRILVRVTKQNLFDINELQDICLAKYNIIELGPLTDQLSLL